MLIGKSVGGHLVSMSMSMSMPMSMFIAVSLDSVHTLGGIGSGCGSTSIFSSFSSFLKQMEAPLCMCSHMLAQLFTLDEPHAGDASPLVPVLHRSMHLPS